MARQNYFNIEIPIPDNFKILISGFFGGILPGIAIKTGISLDSTDWSITFLKEICRVAAEGIPFNCYALVTLISLLIAFLAFLSVWAKVVKIKSFRIKNKVIPGFVIGLFFYSVGSFLGIVSIIKLIS